MQKRVLEVVWALTYGGIEQVVMSILKNIDLSKFHIDFISCWEKTVKFPLEDEIKEYGSEIYRLTHVDGKKSKKIYLNELEVILATGNYDCVHAHQDFLNISILQLAKKYRIPVRVSHVHTSGIGNANSLKNKLKQILLRSVSTHCLATSEESGKFYYGKKGKYIVYRNAINLKDFSVHDEKKFDKYSLITVCRICDVKNPYFLLDIMKCLMKINEKYNLLWIGDGEMMNEVCSYAEKNNITNVTFIGAKSNIAVYVKKYKYFLLPSKKEGFGISALEAQAGRAFCFLSDGFPQDIDFGYMVRYPLEWNAEIWAKQINDFIVKKRIRNYELNINRLKEFDIDNNIKIIEKIYENSYKS